jgi:hypothetical protein
MVATPIGATLAVMLLLVEGIANGQQANSGEASAIWEGENGPPWPIAARVDATHRSAVRLRVRGHPGVPWALFNAPAGVRKGSARLDWGLVDLDLRGGVAAIVDGIADRGPWAEWGVLDGEGAMALALPVGAVGEIDLGGMQALLLDPTSPAGYRLSAATHLVVKSKARSTIYVSVADGVLGGAGTRESPLATISEGIARSEEQGSPYSPIYVAVGHYLESPILQDGISIYGGLDPDTWQRIDDAHSVVHCGHVPVVASEISLPTEISGIAIRSEDALTPGSSSIALHADTCSSLLHFRDCRFVAGRGADGEPGRSGRRTTGRGAHGESGRLGYQGGAGGPAGDGDGPGGSGGAGGFGAGAGWPGAAGHGGTPPGTGGGREGGDGDEGRSGTMGAVGSHGAEAPRDGNVVARWWRPGRGGDGEPGEPGNGGGGGGGGAGAVIGDTAYTGGGGGGGGAGGAGGAPGKGGTGGGASFAVYLFDASPLFDHCTFISRDGGDGGPGGNGVEGRPGGNGGSGADGELMAGRGGAGGAGGPGGAGGGGAGGAGGPSRGLYRAGTSTPTLRGSPRFELGSGGRGGAGGRDGNAESTAPTGPDATSSPW